MEVKDGIGEGIGDGSCELNPYCICSTICLLGVGKGVYDCC